MSACLFLLEYMSGVGIFFCNRYLLVFISQVPCKRGGKMRDKFACLLYVSLGFSFTGD